MTISPHERSLLPFIAMQGAIGTSVGFIGYFVVGDHNASAMFGFTALMLTIATAVALFVYGLGAKLSMTGKRVMQIGFLVPAALFLFGGHSVAAMAAAFGSFLGLTWSARYWLEMSVLADAERDSYASHSGAAAVVGGIAATLLATALLAMTNQNSQYLYWLYGMACLVAGLTLGRRLPHIPMKPLVDPIGVLKQPAFQACFPLFFLESGLYGLGFAVGSVGAASAISSASSFGWVSTVAGLVGALALYLTRKSRGVDNRAGWLGGSCLAVAVSFVLLGASAWLPVLYVAHSVLKAAAGPFLSASENVLNQRALDIQGELCDRIFARDIVLWVLRMASLLGFWAVSGALTPAHLLAIGAGILAIGVALEYVIGQAWFSEDQPAAAVQA